MLFRSPLPLLSLTLSLATLMPLTLLIQLKNISGIILIDFINMADDEQYRALEELVVELLKNDRVKSVVHGFTQTGLLEITRKRTSGGEHNEVKQ